MSSAVIPVRKKIIKIKKRVFLNPGDCADVTQTFGLYIMSIERI